MTKHLGGVSFGFLAGVFILGVVTGVNWYRWEEGTTVLWRDLGPTGGLPWLVKELRKDKSERIALLIATEKNQYQLSALNGYHLYAELRPDK